MKKADAIIVSWDKPANTKLWYNYYEQGETTLLGRMQGNSIPGADVDKELQEAYFGSVKAYEESHTQGYIVSNTIVINGLTELLSKVPATRTDYAWSPK